MALSKEEEKILRSINEFEKSEEAPKFPITPTYQIKVPGFSNVWIKDESRNPTGTHKDRMAWEIVNVYREILRNKKESDYPNKLPTFSIISAGSAANAIQTQLKRFGLPDLKVLLDSSTEQTLVSFLRKIGCKIYLSDFENKPLSTQDILKLTDNKDGFDITSNKAFDPSIRFYDWLSYEVLNQNPDYVFVPYGTGQLYENILSVNRRIILNEGVDTIFSGNKDILRHCSFMGATTNDEKSIAVKLYAPFRPFTVSSNEWVKLYSSRGFCGRESQISEIEKCHLDEAIKIFKEQKIVAEPSATAGLALMLQMRNQLPKNKKMLIVSTGKTKYS